MKFNFFKPLTAIALIAAATVGFTSCEKDDDTTPAPEKAVAGTYEGVMTIVNEQAPAPTETTDPTQPTTTSVTFSATTSKIELPRE